MDITQTIALTMGVACQRYQSVSGKETEDPMIKESTTESRE
jgi:hypothetical protein